MNLRPLITETTLTLAKKGWYTFAAPLRETKNSLRKKVGEAFKVDVLDVKTLVVKGKKRRSLRTRRLSKLSDWKKVMVKVKEGQKIDLFDQA